MANDGILEYPSNSADYYQFSNANLRRELNYRGSKLHVYHQINSSEKTAFLFQFVYFQYQDFFSLQILVLLKLQMQLYQKVRSFASQYIFINEMITSRNSYKNLYTA